MYQLPPVPKFPMCLVQMHPVLRNLLRSGVLHSPEQFSDFPDASGVAWIWIRVRVILELGVPTNLHKSGAIINQGKERETS